jgi:hypothetical protein
MVQVHGQTIGAKKRQTDYKALILHH